jgi:hypothetical protein
MAIGLFASVTEYLVGPRAAVHTDVAMRAQDPLLRLGHVVHFVRRGIHRALALRAPHSAAAFLTFGRCSNAVSASRTCTLAGGGGALPRTTV